MNGLATVILQRWNWYQQLVRASADGRTCMMPFACFFMIAAALTRTVPVLVPAGRFVVLSRIHDACFLISRCIHLLSSRSDSAFAASSSTQGSVRQVTLLVGRGLCSRQQQEAYRCLSLPQKSYIRVLKLIFCNPSNFREKPRGTLDERGPPVILATE